MMTNRDDLLHRPHDVIDGLFESAMRTTGNVIQTSLVQMDEKEVFDRAMQDDSFAASVPYLSKTSHGLLPANSLCRFRGLVQDIYGMEMFCAALTERNGQTGKEHVAISKYRDVFAPSLASVNGEMDVEMVEEKYADRLSFLCVPLPGQSYWTRNEPSQQHHRHARAAAVAASAAECVTMTAASDSGPSSRKRDSSEMEIIDGDNNSSSSSKKPVEEKSAPSSSSSSSIAHAAPMGHTNEIDMLSAFNAVCPGLYDPSSDVCCLVRMYDCRNDHDGGGDGGDDHSGGNVRLNDMIEILGIYTADPLLTTAADPVITTDDNDAAATAMVAAAGSGSSSANAAHLAAMLDPYYGFAEDDVMGVHMAGGHDQEALQDPLPPPSVAPRLHCITFRRLGSSFPLLLPVTAGAVAQTGASAQIQTTSHTSLWHRNSNNNNAGNVVASTAAATSTAMSHAWVVRHLTHALAGDALAAEYVALAMLSRLRSREHNESLLLGVLSLNLCGFETRATSRRGVSGSGDDGNGDGDDPRMQALLYAIEDIVPRCVLLQADAAALDAVPMYPSRDDIKNRLSLSPLQLGAGTVVLVNETGLAGRSPLPPLFFILPLPISF